MAMGLPVVTTKALGAMDVATDRTAFLVPPVGTEEAFGDAPQIVHYERGHTWARLDPAAFATAMRYVVQNPGVAGWPRRHNTFLHAWYHFLCVSP
jgi:hypothetical protein